MGSAIAYAGMDIVEAIKVHHPISMDYKQIEYDFPMLSVDDRVYLPLRAMCDLLDIYIDWDDEEGVTILTDNSYTPEYEADIEVDEEMAVDIANIIFEKYFGEKYLDITDLIVTDEGCSYSVYRRYKDNSILGGDCEIKISKADGRIISVIPGE